MRLNKSPEATTIQSRWVAAGVVAALVATAVGPVRPAAQDSAAARIRQELAAPFSYFRAPTDQLGFKESPKAIIVTYDGAFVSAYGELSFFVGTPGAMRPVNQRVKTLV